MIADRYIRRSVVAVALLSPFMGGLVAGFPISIIDLMMPIFILVMFTGGLAASPMSGFYFAYIGVCVVSSLAQLGEVGFGDVARSAIGAVRQIAIFAPFMLVFCVKNIDEAFIARVVRLAMIGLCISVLAGVFMHYAGLSVAENQQFWQRSFGRYTSSSRAGGLSGNSGAYGLTVVAFAMAVFVAMPATGQKVGRGFAWFSALIVLIATYVSSSRGGLVQLLLLLAPLIMLGRIKVAPGAVLIGLLAVSGMVLLFALTGTPLPIDTSSTAFQRLDILNLSGQSSFLDSTRGELFSRAIATLPDYWLIGVGYKRQIEALELLVDNSFLLILLETGVFALLFFSLFWLALLYRIVSQIRRERVLSVVVLFIYASVILRMMVSAVHSNWNAMPVIYLLMAVLLRASILRGDRLAAEQARTSDAVAERDRVGMRGDGPPPLGVT